MRIHIHQKATNSSFTSLQIRNWDWGINKESVRIKHGLLYHPSSVYFVCPEVPSRSLVYGGSLTWMQLSRSQIMHTPMILLEYYGNSW